MSLKPIPALVIIAALVACESKVDSATRIDLTPGQDIQDAIDAAPPGTSFHLAPGIYRGQSFEPKDGQSFIGEPGTVISGAVILKNWRRSGGQWVAEGLPAPLRGHGQCYEPLCELREDLFLDGKLLKRVDPTADLAETEWFYADNAVHMAADPRGQVVEMSYMPVAIHGSGDGVVLENITVEKYASAAQYGAIDARDGSNWTLREVVVQWNHGVGLYMSDGMLVSGGAALNNGQLGIGGIGDNVVIENVEIAYNNYAGYSWAWEAGGTKFVRSNDLIVRNNCVHNNIGPGLWTDIDNVDALYESNLVFDNAGDGIKHEISFDAIIRGNIASGNGWGKDNWLWGSQILIQNSSGVVATSNLVEIAGDHGNGLGLIYQDRGASNVLGEYITANNRVEGNQIVFLGDHGSTGIVADVGGMDFWESHTNVIDNNLYVMPAEKNNFVVTHNRHYDLAGAQEHGLERNGVVTRESRQPTTYDCTQVFNN
jgi:hypothetical protein